MKTGALMLSLLVVACGGSAPATTLRSFPPELPSSGCGGFYVPGALTACATPPAPTPTPTPTLDRPALELPIAGSPVEPGRYTRSAFQPRVEFHVGPGWTAEQVAPGFFGIEDEPGSLDVVAVQFANVVGPKSAVEALDEIAALANLRLSDPIDGDLVDGRVGIRFNVETTDPADTDPPNFRPVLTVPAGPISIASGRRLQVTLLDVESGVLAILVGGSIAEWNHALELATPVVDSITIED